MKLPSDIARCVSAKCKRRNKCLRWICKADVNARVFVVGNDEDCEWFIDSKTTKTQRKKT